MLKCQSKRVYSRLVVCNHRRTKQRLSCRNQTRCECHSIGYCDSVNLKISWVYLYESADREIAKTTNTHRVRSSRNREAELWVTCKVLTCKRAVNCNSLSWNRTGCSCGKLKTNLTQTTSCTHQQKLWKSYLNHTVACSCNLKWIRWSKRECVSSLFRDNRGCRINRCWYNQTWLKTRRGYR